MSQDLDNCLVSIGKRSKHSNSFSEFRGRKCAWQSQHFPQVEMNWTCLNSDTEEEVPIERFQKVLGDDCSPLA